MVKFVDEELVKIRKEILDMWTLVYDQMRNVCEAIPTSEKEKAWDVLIREKRVNASELKLDCDVEDFLVLYNPVAIDLRFALAMLKINTDLERIGDFAENITTEGINLMALPLGTQLKIGDDVLLELSQQGKVCHKKCAIFYLAGDCIFPREGIFFVALTGGKVKAGDSIDVVKLGDGTCEYTPQEALDELANTPR